MKLFFRFLNNFREILNAIVFSLFMIGISWLCSGLFQLKPVSIIWVIVISFMEYSKINNILILKMWNSFKTLPFLFMYEIFEVKSEKTSTLLE